MTGTGDWLALDAKMTIDDNALFRHPVVRESLRDLEAEDPPDRADARASPESPICQASAGDIGCIVNGAGLVMATMDAVDAQRRRARELP